jgi:hypothetical protein
MLFLRHAEDLQAVGEADIDAGERDERRSSRFAGCRPIGVTGESAVIGIDDSFN